MAVGVAGCYVCPIYSMVNLLQCSVTSKVSNTSSSVDKLKQVKCDVGRSIILPICKLTTFCYLWNQKLFVNGWQGVVHVYSG